MVHTAGRVMAAPDCGHDVFSFQMPLTAPAPRWQSTGGASMSRPPLRGPVTRSALGWLQRLGWRYLAPNRRVALGDVNGAGVLEGRLREYLHQVRFHAHGDHWPLDADGIAQVLAMVVRGSQRRGWLAAHQAVLVWLREGVCVAQQLPDGRRVQATVPLVDVGTPLNNHWDIANAREQGQPPRDATPRVDVLEGYVNGLPVLRLLCVERDGQGRWGREDVAIALHHAQQHAHAARGAPLVLALDRRGGRYAGHATAADGWVRWREHGWDAERALQLRQRASTPSPGTPDPHGQRLWAVHAPLLAGVAEPARLLALLRGFVHTASDGRQRIARSAQFFAVQAGVAHLQDTETVGGRRHGCLQLAAGSGMALTVHWLSEQLRGDPVLRHCRVLRLQAQDGASSQKVADTLPSAGQALAAFMADGRGCTLQTTPGALQSWLRHADTAQAGHDLIVLADAHLRGRAPVWLDDACERLPHARWLWLSSGGMAAAPAQTDMPVLFACSDAEAIADGLVVPVYHHRLMPSPASPQTPRRGADHATEPLASTPCWAAPVAQHLRDTLAHTERDLRALLLVADTESQHRYHHAFAQEGAVHSAIVGSGPAHERGAIHSAQLLVASDLHALPWLDARLALVYLDTALDDVAAARVLALVNRRHPHKHCAWLVCLPAVPAPWSAGAPDAATPQPLRVVRAGLSRQHRRLHALLPPGCSSDFHACRDHLGPRWHLDAHGQQRDQHRLRRRCLHQRVTAFGQQLQAALLAPPCEGDADTPLQRYRYDLHFCSLLRDAVGEEAAEQPLSVAEDVRIRHWARERAPEVRDVAWDYLGPAATSEGNPGRAADALHSQLRHQLETGPAGPAARRQLQRQLQMLLARPVLPAERLQQLRRLHAQHIVRRPTRDGSPAAGDAPPSHKACDALLAQTLGAPKDSAQRRLQHALATQLASAMRTALAAQPQAPHLAMADLQRRLAPAWATVLSPRECEALRMALQRLLDDMPPGTASG